MESNTKSSSHALKYKFKVSCFTCSSSSSTAVTVQASSAAASSSWLPLPDSFEFSQNEFTGNIPESFKNMKPLLFLSLSSNSFPDLSEANALRHCRNLSTLILSKNFMRVEDGKRCHRLRQPHHLSPRKLWS
ncbi:hypothetical protein Bca4012_006514 [Brassica carinata]